MTHFCTFRSFGSHSEYATAQIYTPDHVILANKKHRYVIIHLRAFSTVVMPHANQTSGGGMDNWEGLRDRSAPVGCRVKTWEGKGLVAVGRSLSEAKQVWLVL